MPGRKTHKIVGTLTGAALAAYQSREQGTVSRVVETVGGLAGAYFGSTVADDLEPAISSWHRADAHSCAAGLAILATADALAEFLRMKADQWRTDIPMQPVLYPQGIVYVPASANPSLQWLYEMICRFLAGFVTGFAAAYASHLALDALSPRSIPVLPKL